MIKHRIHYLINEGNLRCGRSFWYNSTSKPSEVTCGTCKRLMAGEIK